MLDSPLKFKEKTGTKREELSMQSSLQNHMQAIGSDLDSLAHAKLTELARQTLKFICKLFTIGSEACKQ